MTIALAAFHGVRSSARERLRLSCGLRGNGMAFSTALLRRCPPRAYSIVEDLEYGLQLGYAGVRVAYVQEAQVWGHMAVTERSSRSQRQRWERGRHALRRSHLTTLLRSAWRRRDVRLLDLAVDLSVPPLGELLTITLLGLMASAMAVPFGAVVAPWLWAVSVLCLVGYVLRAVAFSGAGLAGVADLGWVPMYLVWKFGLRIIDRGRRPVEWVRTTREAKP
jgi:cellulose synthase/poly-beta-1,6-N-acetylglucosamine synthase-like glycosyltransferase